MKIKQCMFLIFFTSIITLFTWANDFSHIYFKSTPESGSVEFSVDYTIHKTDNVSDQNLNMRTYASNIWINVYGNFKSSDVVEAYLITTGGNRDVVSQSQYLLYDLNENKFTGKFDDTLFSVQDCPAVYASYNNKWYCESGWRLDSSRISNQKIAIRINNSWSLINPQGQSHDFSFSFLR